MTSKTAWTETRPAGMSQVENQGGLYDTVNKEKTTKAKNMIELSGGSKRGSFVSEW
jgi:hypothetical protein